MIPNNLTSDSLLKYISEHRSEISDNSDECLLLERICALDLIHEERVKYICTFELTEEEKKIIRESGWLESSNIEISARCNDIFIRYSSDKLQARKTVSEKYISLYDVSKKYDALERAVEVVNIKTLRNLDFISTIVGRIALDETLSPYQFKRMVIALRKTYSGVELSSLECLCRELLNRPKTEYQTYHHDNHYADALYILDSITKDEYHRELALLHEKQGDKEMSERQPNTIYPGMHLNFQRAFDVVKLVKSAYPEDYERIKNKLISSLQEFADDLQQYGIKTSSPLTDDYKKHVENYLSNITFKSYYEVIGLIRSLPYVGKEYVDGFIKICHEASSMSSMFGSARIDQRGNNIGEADPLEGLCIEAHVVFRTKMTYFIQKTIAYAAVFLKRDLDERDLFSFLIDVKPSYIDDSSVELWCRGLVAGLCGDMVTLAYMLMPQIESALRNKAEELNGNQTTLENKRQLQTTLGAILPQLETVLEPETYKELDYFLQNGADTNFRNNLLHGLCTQLEIYNNGTYLLKIAIDLYFQSLFKA